MPRRKSIYILTGASRGLGLALGMQILNDPMNKILTIQRHPNQKLVEYARGQTEQLEQWEADLVQADVIARRLEKWLGHHDGEIIEKVTLINNAGLIASLCPLREAEYTDIITSLQINLSAPMLLTAGFLRATASWSSQRKILNISSRLGSHPRVSQSGYCAAKAGMELYTKCVALEEATCHNGARICAVEPGVLNTAMQAQLRSAFEVQFPDVEYFRGLYARNELVDPSEAAALLLQYLDYPKFGRNPVVDIVEMQMLMKK